MSNPYETQKLVDEYLLFHYGSDEEIVPEGYGDFIPTAALGFAVRTVAELVGNNPAERALDLGCAVGRSAFELSKFCSEVIGIDYSAAFVNAAEAIRSGTQLKYSRLEEGAHTSELVASISGGANPDRVSFETGDAQALRPDLGDFDVVHAANLLCRLQRPLDFLTRLPSLVRSGGTLAMTTPCTWLDEFTPRENWPQGSTLDWVRGHLAETFELVETRDVPFLIREHSRKFQLTVSQGSVWRRL